MAETIVHLRPRAEWPRIARHRWYSGWAPAPLEKLLRLGLARRDAAHDARAGRRARRGGPAPRLDERLDRAGARAHGHDGDRRAHAGRDPHRVARSDPARRDRRCGARAGGGSARNAKRGLRIARRRDLARPGRRPGGAGPSRRRSRPVVQSTARLLTTGGQIGEIDAGRHAACACGSRPSLPTSARAASPTSSARSRFAQRPPGRAAGQPVPLGLLGRPVYVRRPAALRTEHGELCAYVYVDLLPGADLAGLRRARARATSRRRSHPASSSSRPASASNGPASTICSWQDKGGSTGSSRSWRCRCSGCSSCSSATSPRR